MRSISNSVIMVKCYENYIISKILLKISIIFWRKYKIFGKISNFWMFASWKLLLLLLMEMKISFSDYKVTARIEFN